MARRAVKEIGEKIMSMAVRLALSLAFLVPWVRHGSGPDRRRGGQVLQEIGVVVQESLDLLG
jgi:hypothetical protein